jgi:hypothetical protein
MRLIVTPGTLMRWHTGIVRRPLGALIEARPVDRNTTHRNVRSVVLRLGR